MTDYLLHKISVNFYESSDNCGSFSDVSKWSKLGLSKLV